MIMAYKHKPLRFFVTVFALTWGFWLTAALISRSGGSESAGMTLMLLGLIAPSAVAVCTVMFSKSAELKRDFRHKLFGMFRVKPLVVLASILAFFAIIAASILLSAFFGQSLSQFAFVAGFSFAIGGVPTLLTLILTALLEEMGWRSYAEDSLAYSRSWWKASAIFGALWAVWHLPLFLIPNTYQYNIMRQNQWYMVNFIAGIPPLAILFTWVYVKNNRSILACMIFHFFVNFLQEEIAMTQVTKCVETFVLYAAAVIVVVLNRDLFFGTKHIGNILAETRSQNDETRVSQNLLSKRA